jgi:hypothetical protein
VAQAVHGWKVYLFYARSWCGELLYNMQIEWPWKSMCMATRRLIIPGKQTIPLGWLLYIPLWWVWDLTLVLLNSVTAALSDTSSSIFRDTEYSHSFISQEIAFIFFFFFFTDFTGYIVGAGFHGVKVVRCVQCPVYVYALKNCVLCIIKVLPAALWNWRLLFKWCMMRDMHL